MVEAATHPPLSGTRITIRIVKTAVLIILGAAFFFAQSAFWVNHTVFNQASFTEKTQTIITSQSSRDAIASTIIDKALADRPLANKLVGDRATEFVSTILGSDIASATINRAINATYVYVTSSNRQDIGIDLTAIKTPIAGIISFVQNQGLNVNFDPSVIPDQVIFVKKDAIPDISGYITMFILLGAVFWLLVVASFFGYIFYGRHHRRRRAYQALTVLTGVTIIALFIGPFIPPTLASFVQAIQLRAVAEQLASAFLEPFAIQLYISLAILAVAFLAVRFWWVFPKGWNAAKTAVNSVATKKKS